MTKKPNLIILGPQGSGKTTQAELLTKKFHYNLISSGEIVHAIINRGGRLGKELNRYVAVGKLIPVEILIKKIWMPHLKKLPADQGFIFEGTPRNISQARVVERLLKERRITKPWLIYLDIKKSTILQRLMSRKVCPGCGMNYKPKDQGYARGWCLKCKTRLTERQDDKNKLSIARRVAIFYKSTKKVIKDYESKRRLIKINGEQSITEVHQDIVEAIKKIIND